MRCSEGKCKPSPLRKTPGETTANLSTRSPGKFLFSRKGPPSSSSYSSLPVDRLFPQTCPFAAPPNEQRAELKTVWDMWQHHLDALLDVQPILMEALADRGLSQTGVFVEAVVVGGGGGSGGAAGR